MSYESPCSACALGDHSGHDRDGGLRPGLIGGTYCGCTGDCAEKFERMVANIFESPQFKKRPASVRPLPSVPAVPEED